MIKNLTTTLVAALLLFSYPMTATAEWVDIRCTISGDESDYINFLKIDMEAGFVADYPRGGQYPIATIKGDWIWWYPHWEGDDSYNSGVAALNRATGVMYTAWVSLDNLLYGTDPHITTTWECSRPLL